MTLFKKASMFIAIGALIASLAACGTSAKAPGSSADTSAEESADTNSTESTDESASESADAFPKFKGTDFEGSSVDDSIFSQNNVTLLNFWFNDCSACVDEMPALEKFNAALKEKGAELIGVNVQAGESDEDLQEAKDILAKQGVTYKNIYVDPGKEISEYISKIYGYPTTVLVDKDGNIIGEALLGSLNDEDRLNEVMSMVENAINGKEVSTTSQVSDASDTADDEINALIDEENKIFEENSELWDKVMDSIPHDEAMSIESDEYAALLKKYVEKMADSFTEDEIKTLNDGLSRIEEIENKILEIEP